jgi:hypothetical protein
VEEMKDAMQYAPWVRIGLRILNGYVGGYNYANDNDAVLIGCIVVGFVIEALYVVAKRKGWAT